MARCSLAGLYCWVVRKSKRDEKLGSWFKIIQTHSNTINFVELRVRNQGVGIDSSIFDTGIDPFAGNRIRYLTDNHLNRVLFFCEHILLSFCVVSLWFYANCTDHHMTTCWWKPWAFPWVFLLRVVTSKKKSSNVTFRMLDRTWCTIVLN